MRRPRTINVLVLPIPALQCTVRGCEMSDKASMLNWRALTTNCRSRSDPASEGTSCYHPYQKL